MLVEIDKKTKEGFEMKNTKNYGLKKPEGTDFYNVEDFNENMDAVDAKLFAVEMTASEVKESSKTHEADKSNPHAVTKSQVGLSNVENKSSATIRGELTAKNVTDALTYMPMNQALKGAPSGVAELDENGLVRTSQLPSYVDDVLEYASRAKFPSAGASGKIYVDMSTNLTYRWSGTTYVEISPSLALGETSATAYRGDRGSIAYEHSQKTSGNPHQVSKADVGLGNVPNVSTNNQTPSYTMASALAELVSGETLAVAFGKIAQFIHYGLERFPALTREIMNADAKADSAHSLATTAKTTADSAVNTAADAKNGVETIHTQLPQYQTISATVSVNEQIGSLGIYYGMAPLSGFAGYNAKADTVLPIYAHCNSDHRINAGISFGESGEVILNSVFPGDYTVYLTQIVKTGYV